MENSKSGVSSKKGARLSLRGLDSCPSITLAAKRLVGKRLEMGLPVYDFGLGETKGKLPDYIKSAGKQAFDDELTGYANSAGLLELRCEILKWLDVEDHYTPDNVIVSVGAKQALFITFLTICNPGDVVLLDRAPWVSYLPMIRACSAQPVCVDPLTRTENQLKITLADLERVVAKRPNARLLLINSPCNPTGQVYSKEELNQLISFCAERKIFFVLDRLYWKTIFDEQGFPRLDIDNSISPWLIQIDGLSKNWVKTGGLRVGWAVGPTDLTLAMRNLQSHITSGTATTSQYAALKALQTEYDYATRVMLQDRRDLLQRLLKEVPQISWLQSQGGFYSFWDVSKLFGLKTPDGVLLKDSDAVANYLIESAGVVTVSGKGFELDGYLRTCFFTSEEVIEKGVESVKTAIQKLG